MPPPGGTRPVPVVQQHPGICGPTALRYEAQGAGGCWMLTQTNEAPVRLPPTPLDPRSYLPGNARVKIPELGNAGARGAIGQVDFPAASGHRGSPFHAGWLT